MNIIMAGIDHEHAEIGLREQLSFVSGRVGTILKEICRHTWISGATLISTCNRTELYVSYRDVLEDNPAYLLCQAAGVAHNIFQPMFIIRQGNEAVQHLMEVACGLRSQILGEDQIVTQVKEAMKIARDAHTSDAVLETLFRCAVTAGKEVKTQVRLTAVPLSAAHRGVALAEKQLGALEQKRAVVIGNGEMGRLASNLLTKKGCRVTVTLRSYRHGETIVPRGCATQSYENRLESIEGCDLVVSATTSPHYTLTSEQISHLSEKPQLLVDLALPRDIDPSVSQKTGVPCLNMDDLGRCHSENQEERQKINIIMQKYVTRFYEWVGYRESLPVIAELKHTAYQRVCNDRLYIELLQSGIEEEMTRVAVEKTIDMLLGGIKDVISPEILGKCLEKMQKNQT